MGGLQLGRAQRCLQGGEDGARQRGQAQPLGQEALDQTRCEEPPGVAGPRQRLLAGQKVNGAAHGIATGAQSASKV